MSAKLERELARRTREDAIFTTVIAAMAFCVGAGVMALLQAGGVV
ncbi:hypothetical protein [Stenotrophomonas pictorum]|nr:hypothetical protein [Stenotrophomonas pictorum]